MLCSVSHRAGIVLGKSGFQIVSDAGVEMVRFLEALQDVDVFQGGGLPPQETLRRDSLRLPICEIRASSFRLRAGSPSRSPQSGRRLVGLGRLELPTSPLSGVRSSHLSYRPFQIQLLIACNHFILQLVSLCRN